MRIRCPNHGGPFDVPDDQRGQRIVCPYCDYVIFEALDANSEQIKPAGPPARPTVRDAPNLENRVYDGLPPLSVMLALRAQQRGLAYDDIDLDVRQHMTDDDWKALAAFEKLIDSVITLRSALWYGCAALAATLICWVLGVGPLDWERKTNVDYDRLLILVESLSMLGGVLTMASFGLMYLGSTELCHMRLGLMVSLLAWAALVAMLVFAVYIGFSLFLMFGSHQVTPRFISLLSVPFNLVAAIMAGLAAVRVIRSLHQVRPPEILHRLTEAMKYLE
jgi:hypothetical protein